MTTSIPGLLLLLPGNTKIKSIPICRSFFIFVRSRWQQKTCYLPAWISQKKDRQTQHCFLTKTLTRQFDLLSRLSVRTAKSCRRKFAFTVMLRNYDSKILLTQFLVSSEGCKTIQYPFIYSQRMNKIHQRNKVSNF